MKKNVAIVHFNTPELTRAAIQSLWKHTPDCSVVVFDNSDRRPFGEMENVRVIDNTKGQVIDFDEFLSRFPDKSDTENNWGSAKHCYTIQKLWEYLPGGFVLADSDVLFKKDISPLFDKSVAYGGTVYVDERRANKKVPRLYPFLCWINVPMCKRAGVSYFDPVRNWHLTASQNPYDWYDTGASFLEDCRKLKLPGDEYNISNYIIHLGRASHCGTPWEKWLEEHKDLYSMEEVKKKTTGRPKKVAVANEPSHTSETAEVQKNKTKKPDVTGKVLVVIPYLAKEAQGRELEYAIAGWRKHFKEDYLIVVVGDHHPIVDKGDDIYFIDCPRVTPIEGEYTCHLDHVKKFRKVMEVFPEATGFIYTCDDMYAVNDFDLVDVKLLKVRENEIKAGFDSPNEWSRNNAKTKAVLVKEGLPLRNYVCHLPVYYECDKLKAIYDKYDCDNNSYVVEQLYFNTYFPTRIPLVLDIDYDNFLCGVRRSNPRIWYIEEAMHRKIWLQNSIEGWIPAFENILKGHYGI